MATNAVNALGNITADPPISGKEMRRRVAEAVSRLRVEPIALSKKPCEAHYSFPGSSAKEIGLYCQLMGEARTRLDAKEGRPFHVKVLSLSSHGEVIVLRVDFGPHRSGQELVDFFNELNGEFTQAVLYSSFAVDIFSR